MNKKSQVAHAVISKRYKMYKAGKVWLFAGLSALVIGGLGQITASADTTSTASVYTTDTTSTVVAEDTVNEKGANFSNTVVAPEATNENDEKTVS